MLFLQHAVVLVAALHLGPAAAVGDLDVGPQGVAPGEWQSFWTAFVKTQLRASLTSPFEDDKVAGEQHESQAAAAAGELDQRTLDTRDRGSDHENRRQWRWLAAAVVLCAMAAAVAAVCRCTASPQGRDAEGTELPSGAARARRLEPAQEREVREAFARADKDRDGLLSRDEVRKVIVSLPQLWQMLEVNTGIDAERCQDIATTVAMAKLDSNQTGSLSWEEFRSLWTTVLLDPKSQLDFFHQAMFNAFDADGNQSLDREELGHFLEIFYQKGGIFTGDSRLPPKDELVDLALERLDKNMDKRLSFRSLSPLMKGHMQLF